MKWGEPPIVDCVRFEKSLIGTVLLTRANQRFFKDDVVYDWGRLDSNQRNPKVRDLQSLAIAAMRHPREMEKDAGERNRTLNRPLTSRMLCQLSYSSTRNKPRILGNLRY